MKLFKVTHPQKPTSITLLLVYSTCLGQTIFTIGLPGKCCDLVNISRQMLRSHLSRLRGAEISIWLLLVFLQNLKRNEALFEKIRIIQLMLMNDTKTVFGISLACKSILNQFKLILPPSQTVEHRPRQRPCFDHAWTVHRQQTKTGRCCRLGRVLQWKSTTL